MCLWATVDRARLLSRAQAPNASAHILIAVVFFVFAAIQFNDPDPMYWVAVYCDTAFVALASAFRRSYIIWTAIVTGMTIAGLLIAAPGFVDYIGAGDTAAIFGEMRGSKIFVESAREFIGLLITLIALVIYIRQVGQKT